MNFSQALVVLLKTAENDVRGSGLGYRSTSDEWRKLVSHAWHVVFKRIYKREPGDNERFNAGMGKL